MQTLDIDKMLGPTFDFKNSQVISIQGKKFTVKLVILLYFYLPTREFFSPPYTVHPL